MQRVERLRRFAADAGRLAIETVYPPRCSGCGWRGEWVCARCLQAEPVYQRPWCQRCGVPESAGDCRCPWIDPSLTRVRSVGAYSGWLRAGVHQVKYQGESARIPSLAAWLPDLIAEFPEADALVPVPLHVNRLGERGFNQSLLLAAEAGRIVGLPVWEGLIRYRDTPHQVGLDTKRRALNMANAFRAHGPIPNHLILIDDVVTTGATLASCREALLDAGATDVDAITLA